MKRHYIGTKDDLFDPQLVRCVWDEELEGKRCFAADYLSELRDAVNNSKDKMLYTLIEGSAAANYPFNTGSGCHFRYVYYDPCYEMKLAYLNGAVIQYINRHLENDVWHSCNSPCWDTDTYDFRVKPEPETVWRPFDSVREMLGTLDPEGSCGSIWLAFKQCPKTMVPVTGLDYQDDTVRVDGDWYTMQDLFDRFWSNDGPVGIKEMKE